MKYFISHLKLHQQILLSKIFPILSLLIIVGISVFNEWTAYKLNDRTQKTYQMAQFITQGMLELQRERSLIKDGAFKEGWKDEKTKSQYKQTDLALEKLVGLDKNPLMRGLLPYVSRRIYFDDDLIIKIESLRSGSSSDNYEDVYIEYTKIIIQMLNLFESKSMLSENNELNFYSLGLKKMLLLQEYAGKEQALVNSILLTKKPSIKLYIDAIQNIKNQQELTQVFLNIGSMNVYQKMLRGLEDESEIKNINKIRSKILSVDLSSLKNVFDSRSLSVIGTGVTAHAYWLKISNIRLNKINNINELIIQHIVRKSEAYKDESLYKMAMYFILSLIVIFISWFVSFFITKRFESAMNMFNQSLIEFNINGKFSPVESMYGQDELSALSKSFNNLITQKEKSDKNFRLANTILNKTEAVIYVKDKDGFFIYINHQFEKLFNTTVQEIVGKHSSEIFPKDVSDQHLKNDREVFNTGKVHESEEKAPQDDGMHIYSSNKFPLLDDAGNIYAICGISTDITELKLKDEELRQSLKMEALGKLTGGIAHDFNNMLGIMLGNAELLSESANKSSEDIAHIHAIIRAGKRSSKLTARLLDFSRNKPVNSEAVDINECLNKLFIMLERTLTARVKIIFDLAENLSLVKLDAGDFDDAIINISINAMHAMDSNGTLTFETRSVNLNEIDADKLNMSVGEFVLLSITDNGCGMSEEVKSRIFDPFYSSKGEMGTGLGLSQVYGFVERSNGFVKVYSEEGQGSCFSFYFPKSTIDQSEVDDAELEAEISLQGREKLLVVDDEEAIADLAYAQLTAQGYQVRIAYSAKQALEILAKEPVDLLLSDIIMPEMDGYQLCKQVQQLYPHIKIQLASGYADSRHSTEVDIVLYKNMLHKPYTSKQLLTNIRKLLAVSV